MTTSKSPERTPYLAIEKPKYSRDGKYISSSDKVLSKATTWKYKDAFADAGKDGIVTCSGWYLAKFGKPPFEVAPKV